jgi:hypothetical protein
LRIGSILTKCRLLFCPFRSISIVSVSLVYKTCCSVYSIPSHSGTSSPFCVSHNKMRVAKPSHVNRCRARKVMGLTIKSSIPVRSRKFRPRRLQTGCETQLSNQRGLLHKRNTAGNQLLTYSLC